MSIFTLYPVSKEALIAHFESEFDIANFEWVTYFQSMFDKPFKDIIKEIIETSFTDGCPGFGELVDNVVNSYYNGSKTGMNHHGVMQAIPHNVGQILNKVIRLLPLTPIKADQDQWKTSNEDVFLMVHKRCPRLTYNLLNKTYSLVDGLSLMKPNALLTDFVSAGHRDRIFKESDFPLSLETWVEVSYEVDGSLFLNKSKADKELLAVFEEEGFYNMLCKIRESNNLRPDDIIMFTRAELKAGLDFFFRNLTIGWDDDIADIRMICDIRRVMTSVNNSVAPLNVLAVAYGIYRYLKTNKVSKLKKINNPELTPDAEMIGISETNYGITYFLIGLFKDEYKQVRGVETNIYNCIYGIC